ncbi:winged helix DNA-binding domain-containing protein [Nocardia sp. NPDC057668]|uniref:winged helix DNA-binding domain-containing protein n=1 Tax=Nocardia sp. NPDC057668 TaxID=3346202 RepID=UPI00366BD0C7
MTEISLRTLNRTLLTRQLLVERAELPAADLVRRLVAVQGQEPNWPYVGLWTRLAGFGHDELAALLRDRTVVRSTMIRRTVHLAAADDYRWLYPTVRAAVEQLYSAAYFQEALGTADRDEFRSAGAELLAGRTLSRRELGLALAERFPSPHPGRLAQALGVVLPLIHDDAAGVWGAWRNRRVSVSLAPDWIGEPVHETPDPETLILRYLAAFGPASVADMQAWSGVTRLAAVVARLRPNLRVHHDDTGRELFDLPEAPLADPDLPVPVRFLPAFDNATLGHRDRRRIISDADRARINRIASAGVPMYLVDGFVHGTWAVEDATIRVTPWHPFTGTARAEVRAEAEALLPFIAPGEDGKVIVESV